MVVTTLFRVFIVHDWKVIKEVPDAIEHGETWDKMGFFMPFPNYDEDGQIKRGDGNTVKNMYNFNIDKLPFIIISARFSIWLLNVVTGYIAPFISTKASVSYGQQAFFF